MKCFKIELKNLISLLAVFIVVVLCSCSSLDITKTTSSSALSLDKDTLPVVVVGGGIAGLTAAVYLMQANIPALVIEGEKVGGALAQSHSVRNWPGVIQAPGMKIVEDLKNQALASGAHILTAKVTKIDVTQRPFVLELESLADGSKQIVKTITCILAMGREPSYLGVPGEKGDAGYWGRGVSDCAVCDGRLYKDRDVVVVGGGDAALQEASYLSDIAKTVTLLVRKDSFRAKDVKERDAVISKPQVKVLFNTEVKEIKGDGKKVTGVVIHNNKTNIKNTLSTDGVFLAIGARPNTALIKGQVELDAQNYVVLKNYQETSIPGVFAAGDIADAVFAQAVTAADAGARAALQVKRYLTTVGYVIS